MIASDIGLSVFALIVLLLCQHVNPWVGGIVGGIVVLILGIRAIHQIRRENRE